MCVCVRARARATEKKKRLIVGTERQICYTDVRYSAHQD